MQPSLSGDGPVPLEAVLRTDELNRRPSRPPDYETESRTLTALATALADSPRTILQTLAETILEVLRADSAGLSLLTMYDGGKRFYWPAIAGAWKPYVGRGTRRDFGPCGEVLDRNAPLLFTHFERRYPYLLPITPSAEEALLIPFFVNGKPVGTIWALAHDQRRRFDAEDLRQLQSLGRFASAAYQAANIHDAEDQRRAALNLIEDAVQARQAAEKLNAELRKSEARYHTLFDLGPVAVYSCDASGVIRDFNRRAVELWGRAPALGNPEERFCGSARMIRPDGSVLRHDQCPMADVLSGTVPYVHDGEVIVERPDGSRVAVVVNIRPLRNELGEITGAINCFYDITQRKEMEQAIKQQAGQLADESRRKDEFLAMLSHELRNPLAPILSAVYLLQAHESGSENRIQKQAREIIERQVGNLTKLVNDLLEVSRVVSGRIRLDRRTVDLNQVVQHATETVKPLIEQRKHDLVVVLSDEPIWVDVDAARMEEVIINLLNNAAKYTDEGGRIEVHCKHPLGGSDAEVRVRDNGVGIDEELLPRIFDLFTQADHSLARSTGGLGIGLSLAQRLVVLHGGTIEALSPIAEGTGSELIVKLPMTHAPDMSQPLEPATETSPTRDGSKILIVDDNIDQVTMLSNGLRQKGYSVRSAHSGPDGLKGAREWRPDIVLLDIGLPGLDGYEVTKRLRSDPEMWDVRLIAITGYARDTDIALAREAGFDAHLSKPVEFGELEKLIASLQARARTPHREMKKVIAPGDPRRSTTA